MYDNKEFSKMIKSNKAKFYLFDFHVHSPASYDVILGDRFKELSEEEMGMLKDIDKKISKYPERYEEEAINKFPPQKYYDLLVESRDKLAKEENIEEGEDWAFVAITDHNVCSYAEKVSCISLETKNLKLNRLIVLPGIELEIRFTEPKTGEKVNIHTLLIFQGKTSSRDIDKTIDEMSDKGWTYGEVLEIESLPDFIHKMRLHEKHPAICIAAHISSSKGLNAETKKCILNHKDIEILRYKTEIDIVKDQKIKLELEEIIKKLENEKNDMVEISFDILDLMGKCGFDALQIRDKEDEQYYHHIHRYDKKMGRAVAITCSDAHRIEDIFKCNCKEPTNKIMPFIKLNNISSSITESEIFEEIRNRGLRYGETRVTFIKPKSVICWIEGIQIYKDSSNGSDFWISENSLNNEDKSFVLSFSRNLNCIIGGRGSGKSATIEVIEFLRNNAEFIQEGKKSKKTDWYERAKVTLKGCKISMCWKSLNQKELKKSSLFVEGFFDENDRHSSLVYTDIDGRSILPSTIKLPQVDFYRIHDIEEAAKPEKLRKLFDNICGETVEILSKEIYEIKIQLRENREKLIDEAKKIDYLTRENSPLREYARRKKEFNLVNKEKIKIQFESLDKAMYAQNLNNELLNRWSNLIDGFQLEEKKDEIIQIAKDINGKLFIDKNEEKQLRDYCDNLEKFVNSIENNSIDEISNYNSIQYLIDLLQQELNVKMSCITNNDNEIDTTINSLNEELRKEGIEKGAQSRQAKKQAYDESIDSLEKYREYTSKFKEIYRERLRLRKEFIDKCNLRSELRKKTANHITDLLRRSLDKMVIEIEADAQQMKDKEEFTEWLTKRLDWNKSKYKDAKIKALLEKSDFSTDHLKKMLMSMKIDEIEILSVNKESAADGKIDLKESNSLISNNNVWMQIEAEAIKENYGEEEFEELPKEIKEGIYTFNHKNNTNELNLDSVLMLDEILVDDLPVVRLNDRPNEVNSKKKELDKLSPGQRCSAILPIILLTGNNPIIIDQPEDNLDNRLIRQVIVNVLANIKLQRQVIIATHNANLPVLGDAEKVIALRAIDDDKCKVEAKGSLDDKEVVKNITEIMEGGREAFQYRQTIYQSYWENGADEYF